MSLRACWAVLSLLVLSSALGGQEKNSKDESKPPQLLLSDPLAIAPGSPVKVTLRGHRLDAVDEVNLTAGTAKIVSKKKSGPPNGQDAKVAGDSELLLEIELPGDFRGPELGITARSKSLEGNAYALQVAAEATLVSEKEDNDGFHQAQAIAAGQWITAKIKHNKDVDVYRIDAAAQAKLHVELVAAQRGSVADLALTIFAASGELLGYTDDDKKSADPTVDFVAPAAGSYFLTVSDAHHRGGPAHPYCLRVSASQ